MVAEQEEIELKLRGRADVLAQIMANPDVLGAATAPSKTSDLSNTYFDTPGYEFRRNGLALRIRSEDGGFIQTLKAGDSAPGALSRREWEAPVRTKTPDLTAFRSAESAAVLDRFKSKPVNAAFDTTYRRWKGAFHIEDPVFGRGEVEMAVDIGAVQKGAQRVPIAEAELELKSGSIGLLYAAADRMVDRYELALETLSKSARGYHLIRNEAPKATKAVLPPLDAETGPHDAVQAVLKACLAQIIGNIAASYDGRDREGVHQMRVALRRLRSALIVFEPFLAEPFATRVNDDARWVLDYFGKARDLDVFENELLAPVASAPFAASEMSTLRDKVNQERSLAYEGVRSCLDSKRFNLFVLSLGAALEGESWRASSGHHATGSLATFARPLLKKRYKKVLKLGRNFEALDEENRHRVRIALKKFRYAAEYFTGAFPKRRTTPYIKAMKRLQNDLGQMNDVVVAQKIIRHFISRTRSQTKREDIKIAGAIVLGWHANELAGLEPMVIADWRAFTQTPAFWAQPKR